jgi:hypothetical protein
MIDEYVREYMPDYLHDTELVPMNTWCPECSGPHVDERATMVYCPQHAPALQMSHVSWFGEAGGDGNKAICDFLHRHEERK